MIERKQASRLGGKEEGEISTNLQTETGLAPVPPLGVVAVRRGSLAFCLSSLLVSNVGRGEERQKKKSVVVAPENRQTESTQVFSRSGGIYLMVLPVLKRIH